MIKVIRPDDEDQTPMKDSGSIFLAGSIEMGSAIDWQGELICKIAKLQAIKELPIDLTIYNPRRNHWDNTWKQSINNPRFKDQVDWELDKLHQCDIIFMMLDENTKSPISLLELGLYATEYKLMVFCGENFWRRGNVEIVCERYETPYHILNGNELDDKSLNKFFDFFKEVSPGIWNKSKSYHPYGS